MKEQDGKKKRKIVEGNNKEVLVVVKTTMTYFDRLSKIVDTVADSVLHYEKDVINKENLPQFGTNKLEITASVNSKKNLETT